MNRWKYLTENRSGLTLVELIISIAIMGIVVAIASTMIIQGFNLAPAGARRMSAGQMAEMHITEISRFIRNALAEDKINVIVYDDKNDTNKEVVIGTEDKDYICDDNEDNIYFFSGPYKVELDFNEQDKLVFHDITGLKIKMIEDEGNDNNKYSYEIALAKEVRGEEATVKAKITPRNQ